MVGHHPQVGYCEVGLALLKDYYGSGPLEGLFVRPTRERPSCLADWEPAAGECPIGVVGQKLSVEG